jgi:hypothetical protein
MEYAALVILLALVQYVVFTLRVGAGRPKYGVDAPKTEGDETWERLFRVQQNTLEQLIIFIPGAWVFGMYTSASWVLLPGLVFIAGRQLYSHEYISKPSSRVAGMALTLLANATLLVGGLIGVAMKLI